MPPVTTFAKLNKANPHLRWTRSQLAEKIIAQAGESTAPILIGGMTGMGKSELTLGQLPKSAEAKQVPFVRVNLMILNGSWSEVESEITREIERTQAPLAENSRGIVVMEEPEEIIDNNIQAIIQQCRQRDWTPVFTLQSQHLFPGSLDRTISRYNGSNDRLYFLGPRQGQEVYPFIEKWFSPEGKSLFSSVYRNTQRGIFKKLSLAEVMDKRQRLLVLLRSREILDQILELTGGITILLSGVLDELWDENITISGQEIEAGRFAVFGDDLPVTTTIGHWLGPGLPGIFQLIRGKGWFTEGSPLPEAEYQALLEPEQGAIEAAFKFGFLEVREGGLVIRPKAVRGYLTSDGY